jgi:Domain of unknown function (DUF4160)
MPRISSFFGIVISMYWNEGAHQVPHFHARYGDAEASVAFDGRLCPPGRRGSFSSGRCYIRPSSNATGSWRVPDSH